MKRLKINELDFESNKFFKFLVKYTEKKGYTKHWMDLPQDIRVELAFPAMMCFTALDLHINEEFILEACDMEFHCIKKGRYSLLFYADKALDSLGVEANSEEARDLMSMANYPMLSKGQNFKHQLSEIKDFDGQLRLNSYAFASFMISTIRSPEETKDGGLTAEKNLKGLLAMQGYQAEYLIEKIKVGDVRAMMQVCTAVNAYFEKQAELLK